MLSAFTLAALPSPTLYVRTVVGGGPNDRPALGEYNIMRLSAGAGMVKDKGEIKLSFEIQADRS
jgi:hypothetical protein